MQLEHYNQLFPAVCAGLGLFLVGVVNLFLAGTGVAAVAGRVSRSPSRLLLQLLATAGACAAALGVAFVLDQPGLLSQTAKILAIGLVPCLLLGSRRLTGGLAALVASAHRPAVRFGVLAAGGVAFGVGSIFLFEQKDAELAEATLTELDLAHGRVPNAPTNRANASTDRGTQVILKEPTESRSASDLAGPEARVIHNAHLDNEVIRRGPADDRTNCHGWVFTGGRFLLSPDDVELILKENGYGEVPEPRAGDLIVYRQGGTIAHTAVVRYVAEGQPALVEGKWGTLGVFLHPADKSTYGTDYTFHRSPRRGHLLAGLNPNNPNRPNPAAPASPNPGGTVATE